MVSYVTQKHMSLDDVNKLLSTKGNLPGLVCSIIIQGHDLQRKTLPGTKYSKHFVG